VIPTSTYVYIMWILYTGAKYYHVYLMGKLVNGYFTCQHKVCGVKIWIN